MSVYEQENNINDNDSEKLKTSKLNDNVNEVKTVGSNGIDIEALKKRYSPVTRENRTHKENEELAARLKDKFSGAELEPYLAVAYSGIPRYALENHAEIALKKGRPPARLFMFLVGQEALWKEWKRKKEAEKEEARREA